MGYVDAGGAAVVIQDYPRHRRVGEDLRTISDGRRCQRTRNRAHAAAHEGPRTLRTQKASGEMVREHIRRPRNREGLNRFRSIRR